ncbi:MAG: phosphoribosylformylglycinamidine synthase, partial [Candidatus Lambdaproteobacteria bacterium]|nr:phosphoribosylformylglycinamidine synthase [Candidatus Lambdaproteobacteria bacterium]
GGLAVALAESAFAGGLGMTLDLGPLMGHDGLAPDELLFSESPGRLVVTVTPERRAAFERAMAGTPCVAVGTVVAAPTLTIAAAAQPWLALPLAQLKAAWQAPLRGM